MDKIAIISDIHGNLEALKVILSDIKKRGINIIYCLGDIVGKGTHQEECVNLVKENCQVVLLGNNDEYFSRTWDHEFSEIEERRYKWCRSKLSSDSLNYLLNLPFCYEFYLSGRLVRLFHAHPDLNYKFIGNIDTIERLYELFLPSDNTISQDKADLVVYGHIHTSFWQRIYNRTIINTGSVGNAIDVFRNPNKDANVLNTTVANYLILTGYLNSKEMNELNYEFINLPYDIDKELSYNSDNIEKESYYNEIKNGMYRDMDKLNDSFEIRGINKNKI